MSVASRYAEMQKHVGNAYTEISRLGVDLTNVDKNIDNIADKLQEAYSQSPKVTDEGSNLSLTPTRKGGLSITPKGACEQETIAGVEGTTVEGQNISVNDVDSTKENRIIPKGACEQDSYSGKNQLPPTASFNTTNQGTTFTGDGNGTYTISGTNGNQSSSEHIIQDYVIKENDYIHCGNNVANSNCALVFILDNDISSISLSSVDRVYSLSHRAGQTIKAIRLYANNAYNGNAITLSPMIINNVSTVTPFEKYVGGIPSPNPDYPQDIRVVTGDNSVVVQNKNLLDVSSINGIFYGADFDGRDGTLKINGTYQGATYLQIGTVYLKANTIYTSNFVLKSGTAKSGETDISLDLVTYYGNTYKRFNGINEIPADGIYNLYIANGYSSNSIFTNAVYEIQLEKGTTSTSFVKHAEQTLPLHLGTNYLSGIGDYIDLPFKDGDTWKIRRKIGKVVFDGSEDENWGAVGVLGDYYRTAIEINGIKNIINNNDYQGLSTHFIKNLSATSGSNPFPGAMCQFRNTSTVYFVISQSNLTIFRSWLEENNVTLYYQLATPTEETITDTTLITDLNNLYEATNYDGTTNISVEIAQGNAQPYLEYHYNYVTQKPSPDRPSEVKVVTGDNSVVVQNKNLFDKSKMTNGGINRSTGEFVGWNSSRASDYIEINPSNTYYLSINVFVSETNGFAFYDKNKTFISGITARNLINNIPSNAKYFRFCFRIDGSYPSNPDEVQFEIGTTATTYVAHAEQTYTLHLGTNYLAGIGDYKDEIVGKTDEWKIKRYVDKIRLPNNKGGYNSGNNWYYISVTDLGLISPYSKSVISTHFTYYDITTFTASNNLNGISISSAGTYILIRNTNCTSEAEYRTFLSNNNVDVIAYKEAEETITNQTLITDLNNMYQALSYDGTTNITITSNSNNAQMTASVSALKGE